MLYLCDEEALLTYLAGHMHGDTDCIGNVQ